MLAWLNQGGVLTLFLEGALAGAAVAVGASACAFALGLVLGVALLWARLSRYRLLRGMVMAWVSAIRGTPALIHMLLAYYVVPPLLGLSISPLAAASARSLAIRAPISWKSCAAR